MKTLTQKLLAIAVLAAALFIASEIRAAQRDKSPDDETFDVKKFIVKMVTGGDRDLVVPIPHSIRYKSRYSRLYVQTYIAEWNSALYLAGYPWANDRSEVGIYNHKLYRDERLVTIRDLDEVAPNEEPDPQYMARHGPREDHARIVAQKAVREDIRLIAKKERKK
jgi:hypothetical protein